MESRDCINTLSVHICVQHDGRNASRRAGLSAAAETCFSCKHRFREVQF